uniref:Glycosyl hydrolase family 98 putative carbohydrate-binding module domain-containing protein n=1 Tax=Rhodosorus marinus TaxID=101924 RepID=A0A7S0BQX5_9RHOD|mmetsp:Transcript_5428/g.7557  ORF Transcript_5428/g.7557 Transcript_5428/m.7557 type:complete len:1255 (+) Transcript_5428:192-3956(+)
MRTFRFILGGILLGLFLNGIVDGVIIDRENIVNELVAESDQIQTPIDIDWIPGDVTRMLICDKRGIIFLMIDGELQPKPFLDIRSKVESNGSRGLFACLVDKDFSKNPYIYLSYVDNRVKSPSDRAKAGKIVKYRINSALTGATGEVVLVGKQFPPVSGCGSDKSIGRKDIICLDANQHNIGYLVQNPDNGEIFAGLGDAAVPSTFDNLPFRAFDLDFLVGKVLCIQRNGRGCRGNPFVRNGNLRENRGKVWSYGYRFPFRGNWDPVNKLPLTAHVGFARYESIVLTRKGLNFGWPCLEGPKENPKAATDPICKQIKSGKIELDDNRSLWDYDHNFGTSVTGVERLSSNKWPASMRNLLAVADYTKSWIKLIEVTRNGIVGKPQDLLSDVLGPVQVKQGPDGHLYYISILAQSVSRIRFELDTSRPEVVQILPPFGSSNAETTTPVEIKFSKRIDFDTVNRQRVRIVNAKNNKAVATSFSWDAARNTVVAQPNGRLARNTDYDVTVSGIKDNQGRAMAGTFRSSFKTGTGFSLYISDLDFVRAVNGKERVLRDKQPFQSAQKVQPPLSIRGTIYSKGLGVHAKSEVVVDLPQGCTRFQAYVGVDDLRRNLEEGELFFEVLADNRRVFYTENPTTKQGPAVYIDTRVAGARRVSFIMTKSARTGPAAAVGTWGDAQFRCGGYDTARPKVTKISPGQGLGINGSIDVTFSEPMDVASTVAATELLLPIALGGYDLGFTTTFSKSLKTMTIKPNQPLLHDTEYQLTIDGSAEDLSQNRLSGNVQRNLKTAAVAPAGERIGLVELVTRGRNPAANFRKTGGGGGTGTRVRQFNNGIAMTGYSVATFQLPGSGCTSISFVAGKENARKDGETCRMKMFEATGPQGAEKSVFDQEFTDSTVSATVKNRRLTNARRLRLVVAKSPPAPGAVHCSWAAVQLTCGGQQVLLTKQEVVNRVGNALGINKRRSGQPIALRIPTTTGGGGAPTKIELKPNVEVKYITPGVCSTLNMRVDAKNGGSANVQLLSGNGRQLCQTGTLRSGTGRNISCNVRGVSRLTLKATGSGGVAEISNANFNCAKGSREPRCEFGNFPANFKVKDEVCYSATCYNFKGQVLPASAVSWVTKIIHCQALCHEHEEETTNGNRGCYTIPDHGDFFFMEFDVIARDGDAETVSTRQVRPQTVSVTVTTMPPGISVGVDSLAGPSPLKSIVIVGAKFTANVPSESGRNTFKFWDDNRNAPGDRPFQFNKAGTRTYNAVYTR